MNSSPSVCVFYVNTCTSNLICVFYVNASYSVCVFYVNASYSVCVFYVTASHSVCACDGEKLLQPRYPYKKNVFVNADIFVNVLEKELLQPKLSYL